MGDLELTTPVFVAITLGFAFLLFAIITMTSFIKISIVFFLLRNALGLQQVPPNIVIYGVALLLSFFVMSPVMQDVSSRVTEAGLTLQTFADFERAWEVGSVPVRGFLERFSLPEDRETFMGAAERLWPEGETPEISETDISILIPAFMNSELRKAFEIGLLIYLPFIIIDLFVTTVLMATGMQQVQPNLISTPLKLFLFVSVDGWFLLVEGLTLSYSYEV
ncbi:MAG: type III secretion system export apparatus subunit SctR [Pseudomonadota bacterium]